MRNKFLWNFILGFFLVVFFSDYKTFAQTQKKKANSKINREEHVQDLKSEIISQQSLSEDEENLGTFGQIINKLFSIPSGFNINDVIPIRYTKNNLLYENYTLAKSKLGLTLVRSSERELVKVIFYNYILLPYESRKIQIDFNDPNYPESTVVKIEINPWGAKIRYSNLLLFKPGQTEPYWVKDKSAKLWGENSVSETQELLNQLIKETIEYQGLDPRTKEFGFLNKFQNFVSNLSNMIKDEDILLVSNINLSPSAKKSLWADYYLLNEFNSISVIRNQYREIKTIFIIGGYSLSKMFIYQVDFKMDGLDIIEIEFDAFRSKFKSPKRIHIPLGEIEPLNR